MPSIYDIARPRGVAGRKIAGVKPSIVNAGDSGTANPPKASDISTSAARATLMQDITTNMNQDASGFGIRIVDVRIRRADLPEQNSEAIYQRMQKERERQATEYRAEGAETEQRIKARADREVTVLLAEATRESQILRGQGDAAKTRTLGTAYSKDPEFFAFYRSMQAYQDALPGDNTTLVISPDSDFFRYFGSSDGAVGGKGKKK